MATTQAQGLHRHQSLRSTYGAVCRFLGFASAGGAFWLGLAKRYGGKPFNVLAVFQPEVAFVLWKTTSETAHLRKLQAFHHFYDQGVVAIYDCDGGALKKPGLGRRVGLHGTMPVQV